ncbi:MAG: hypothetical protein U0R76_03410 [Candidatus Nanopelagicales bacterium]
MPDATVIPISGGDEPGRKAASRAAREAGATGPRARKVKVPTADVVAAATDAVELIAEGEHDIDGSPSRLDEGLAEWLDFLRRRLTGEYQVDDFGFDPELTDRVLLAPLRPLYEKWFRVETRGIENVPSEGARSSWPTTPARSRSTR